MRILVVSHYIFSYIPSLYLFIATPQTGTNLWTEETAMLGQLLASLFRPAMYYRLLMLACWDMQN